MKYMTFNSSCSYAGIANMLEQFGFDTDDRSIALSMHLPYLFAFKDGVYLSGPMLQTAEWFNLYLNPIGYQMAEKVVSADCIEKYLMAQKTAMLGMNLERAGKHAVVYIGKESDRFVFINNKWETEDSQTEFQLTGDQLKDRIDPVVIVATLHQIPPRNVDFSARLQSSIPVLRANAADIIHLSNTQETVADLRSRLNTLFRPLFLDGITMLNMIGETALAKRFGSLQQELLCALRQAPSQSICLKEYISIPQLQESVEMYIQLIVNALEAMTKA